MEVAYRIYDIIVGLCKDEVALRVAAVDEDSVQPGTEQEVSPYSTFKIISTLIGLHNDIIKDETSTMNYDGTQYPNPEWNENLTLQKAFQTSILLNSKTRKLVKKAIVIVEKL